MKTHLTRPQFALVLIEHIFKALDVHNIEELLAKAIVCDEDASDSSLPKLLDYLKDVLSR